MFSASTASPGPTSMAGLRARARRVWRALRRVGDRLPISWLGLLVLALATGALVHYGLGQQDLVWLVASASVIGMVASAVLATLLGALRIFLLLRRRPRVLEGRTLETERELPTGFALPTLRFFPLLRVRWEWEEPEEVAIRLTAERGDWQERMTPAQRGRIERVRRRILVEDVLGLARFGLHHEEERRLTIVPHVGGLGQMPLLISMSGGEEVPHPMGVEAGDRVEIRRYAPGDPARFIHWKAFGRTRKLMVRMPERALSRARRVVAYQIAGEDDEASAAAAKVAVESGSLGGDWCFGADGSLRPAETKEEAVAAIVSSATEKKYGAAGLSDFVERAERAGPASLVLFAPPRPGAWIDRTKVVLRQRGRTARARVVIATDGVHDVPEPSLLARMLLLVRRPAGTPRRELSAVLAALAALRVPVVLLDRKSGRVLGDRHLAAMRRAAEPGGAEGDKAA